MYNVNLPLILNIWGNFMSVFSGSFLGPLLLFLILGLLIFIGLDIYVFILDNKKYKFSYIANPLLIHDKNKFSTPHMAGMMIFPPIFIILQLIDSGKILHKSATYIVDRKAEIVTYFLKIYGDKNTVNFLVSNSINTITIIIFIKIIITGIYFLVKNINASEEKERNIFLNPSLFMPLGLMAISLAALLSLLGNWALIGASIKLSTAGVKNTVSYLNQNFLFSHANYLALDNFRNSLVLFFLLPLMAYSSLFLLQKYINKQDEIAIQNKTIRFFLYGLVGMIFFLFFGLLFSVIITYKILPIFSLDQWVFPTIKNQMVILSSINNPQLWFILNLLTRDIVIIMFPLLMGGLDDIHKINKKAMTISNTVKFLTFTILGGILSTSYHPYLFRELLANMGKFFIKRMPQGFNYIWLLIFFLMRGLLFNTTINAINFTDGADGLVTVSTYGFFFTTMIIISMNCVTIFVRTLGEKSVSYLLIDKLYDLSSFIVFLWVILIAMGIFFYFNKPKAKIFLGETGSFALATTIFWVMIYSGLDLHLFFCCLMCYWQAFSTTIQTISRKLFKRRVFSIAPFHHSLELIGYSEIFILILYGSINSVLSLMSLIVHLLDNNLANKIILWFNSLLGV